MGRKLTVTLFSVLPGIVGAAIAGGISYATGSLMYGVGASALILVGMFIGQLNKRAPDTEVTSAPKDTIAAFLERRKNVSIYRPDDLPPSAYEPTDRYRKD